MKKNTRIPGIFFPIVLVGAYMVFNFRIECRPIHAGFWFILALGMSIGVSLTLIIHWIKESKQQ